MKQKILLLSVAFVMAMGAYFATNGTTSQKNDLLNKNIEAFSDPQGPIGDPSSIGCSYSRKSTCYVFDGNGILVDKTKNRYPSK